MAVSDPQKGNEGETATAAGSAASRRRYARPTMIEYGTIAKLTQGVGTYNGDGGQMMMPPPPGRGRGLP